MTSAEWFDMVDTAGRVIGSAPRSACHGNPDLLHPVVHCLVLDRSGRMLLQKRHRDKDIQPGKWDTAVGGHLGRGEAVRAGLIREIEEEIGLAIDEAAPAFLYRYVMRNDIESELVHTFQLVADGPFRPQPEEIEALRFWTRDEIDATIGTGALTPNFEDEYRRFCRKEEAS